MFADRRDAGIQLAAKLKKYAGQKGLLVPALPVDPADTVDELKGMVDEIICIEIPEAFCAVGSHYSDFTQVSDEVVVEMLERYAAGMGEDIDD